MRVITLVCLGALALLAAPKKGEVAGSDYLSVGLTRESPAHYESGIGIEGIYGKDMAMLLPRLALEGRLSYTLDPAKDQREYQVSSIGQRLDYVKTYLTLGAAGAYHYPVAYGFIATGRIGWMYRSAAVSREHCIAGDCETDNYSVDESDLWAGIGGAWELSSANAVYIDYYRLSDELIHFTLGLRHHF